MMKPVINIFWFRRDLRLDDNIGLYFALKESKNLLPIFIFDKNILEDLEDKNDKRVQFIYNALEEIQSELSNIGSSLEVLYNTPILAFKQLLEKYTIENVYTNHDYELYASERDNAIESLLKENNIDFKTFKDQVIFEKDEVVKDDGKPYTIFTPFSKKWESVLQEKDYQFYNTKKYFQNFYKQKPLPIISLDEMGFIQQVCVFSKKNLPEEIVKKYTQQRNFPSINGTSKLGVHLRFGTISIRKLLAFSLPLNKTFTNEIIWRDFYHTILWHFPHISKGKAFRQEYDLIAWKNNEAEFEKWCKGETGYPIVDAGMRELNETGFMHSRVRMIVASFLTKHLLIDWRWGEAYFAKKLLDFDFAANNGGWQWAAGSGCDAAPYFRIFNPKLQTEKFDKNFEYIRKWVPEFDTANYPKPIIEHTFARNRCLETYSKVLKKN